VIKFLSVFYVFGFSILVAGAQPVADRKISPLLLKEIAEKNDKDSMDISVQLSDTSALKNISYHLLESYLPAKIFLIRIKKPDAIRLFENHNLHFADATKKAKEELTTGSLDITLNKINYAQHRFPLINGDSILASVKEQQFDTSDIDYKNRIVNSGQAAPTFTTHASIMATIIGGGANTSPFALGAAPGVYLTSATFSSLLPQTDSIYRRYNISIQNHSYGTSIENFYGNEAAAYDASVMIDPVLVHVFSSGNSGTSNATSGIYTSTPGYSNLTGNFKSAKNILVVGATDSFGVVAPLSSRGPAYDGRVKPELVAFGEDGSSGAAAITSGTVALVQQAYKKSKGILPTASFIKAVLVNSADDVNNPHVDYLSGYGNLNASNALNAVMSNRFREDSIVNGQTKMFSLTVPPGIRQLKITISWTDPAAAANAPKALVNDLDLVLHDPSSAVFLPWVLDPVPANILLPAQRKTDTLNNTEQVTVDDPLAGNYTFEIKGSHVATAKQLFAVAWQMDTVNYFHWTFPTSTDQVIAARSNVLRWETNLSAATSIEYSTDRVNWTTVSNSADLSKNYFKWNAPDSFATALLRMKTGVTGDFLSDSFVISKATSVFTGFNCTDSFMLHWHQLNVNRYDLYELGTKYLQPFITLVDTFIVLSKNQHPSLYYAVAPVIQSKPGLRSFTVKYDAQGVGCYFRNFYVQFQSADQVYFTAGLGTLINVQTVILQKLTGAKFTDLTRIDLPANLNLSFADTGLLRGVNYYRLKLILANGAVIYSEVVPVYYYPDLPVIIFPNPVAQNNDLTIISQEAVRYSIRIFDVQGRLIRKQNLSGVNNIIPMQGFSKGIYLISISGENGKIATEKLMVY
jgi:hypothetical protein